MMGGPPVTEEASKSSRTEGFKHCLFPSSGFDCGSEANQERVVGPVVVNNA